MEAIGTVYLYRNVQNGKVYVGQTSQPLEKRHNEHVHASRKLKDRMSFHRALRKHGPEGFELVPLATALTREALDDLEKLFIAQFNANDKRKGQGQWQR